MFRRSPIPNRWSATDWMEVMRAEGALAACKAVREYDSERGVPLELFVRRRVREAIWTRYRREQSYAMRCGSEPLPEEGGEARAEDADPIAQAHETVQPALAQLPENDYGLIERLFWEEWSEADIAREQGTSQQAVNKRKRKILADLRRLIKNSTGNPDYFGC
jgi:RNA polymerase sigma factor (sigma-70 family)